MATAIWTPIANDDLADLAYFIAVEDGRPATADRIIDEMQSKCETYAKQPLMGEAAPHLGEGYRRFVFKRWVVVFKPIPEGIEVLRLLATIRLCFNKERQ